jgi:hypothetical protein
MLNREKTWSKNRNTLRYVSGTATARSYFYGLQIRRTSELVDVFGALSACAFPTHHEHVRRSLLQSYL